MDENTYHGRHLMVAWNFGPFDKSIQIFNSDGVIETSKIGNSTRGDNGESDFLDVLDEYAEKGWDLVNTSTVTTGSAVMIRAFLKKRD